MAHKYVGKHTAQEMISRLVSAVALMPTGPIDGDSHNAAQDVETAIEDIYKALTGEYPGDEDKAAMRDGEGK
jgi:hypothetical protein